MSSEFLTHLNSLRKSNDPYAMAMVVRRDSPSSGKPGDKAVILKDGSIKGWIGGGCTKGIVLKEALLAMSDGKPRLVSINPVADKSPRHGVKSYAMTCQSKGAVDVYIEPVLPMPHILIIGKSHIAAALCKLSKSMGYSVDVVADDADADRYATADSISSLTEYEAKPVPQNTYVIVATQGEGDEQGLAAALNSGAGYIAFIASRIKANAVFNTLRAMGTSIDQLKAIRTPAGLDINAKLPEEVAISILAEVIRELRSEDADDGAMKGSEQVVVPEGYYLNPVCNIPIQKSTAKHVLEYEDEKVYFCCDGCKVSFESDPARYMN